MNHEFRKPTSTRREDFCPVQELLSENRLNGKKSGFSLIEIMVVMFIASVAFLSFYTVSAFGTKYIIKSKNEIAATALTNEKMEIIRNLKYEDVGIQGGSPSGNIPEDEDVIANGRSFHVRTLIQYIDDPTPPDGLFPEDVIPNDYKVAKIIVSWTDSDGQSQEISSISRFVPPGLESDEGGAPLSINVKDSNGTSGVPQANVHIVNNSVVPAINFNIQTDDNGNIMLPSMPPSLGSYQFTITKNGYETVETVDPSSVPYAPTYRHQDVLLGELNMYDYMQDKTSNLIVKTLDYEDNPIGEIPFSIKGGKIIGREIAPPNADVVNMDTTGTTDATSGEKEYPEISPGAYAISMSPNAQYEFIDFDPSVSPAIIIPDVDYSYIIRVADKDTDALFLKVSDSDSGSPIADARITLTDGEGADVFSGKLSSLRGILYYPDADIPLVSGNYTLKVEADEYVSETRSIDIDKLTNVEVVLVKI